MNLFRDTKRKRKRGGSFNPSKFRSQYFNSTQRNNFYNVFFVYIFFQTKFYRANNGKLSASTIVFKRKYLELKFLTTIARIKITSRHFEIYLETLSVRESEGSFNPSKFRSQYSNCKPRNNFNNVLFVYIFFKPNFIVPTKVNFQFLQLYLKENIWN